jgi:putative addiction module component (TIGR02574 family)
MGLPDIDLTSLSDEERLRLLDLVWESFRQDPERLPLLPSQRDELDRRESAYEAGRKPTRPWDAVREEIRRRLQRDE